MKTKTMKTNHTPTEQAMQCAMLIIHGDLWPTDVKRPTAESVASIIDKELDLPWLFSVRRQAETVAAQSLVNAAPELLAALQAVMEFSGFVGGFDSRPGWWTDDAAWHAWVNASESARTAIAKAVDF